MDIISLDDLDNPPEHKKIINIIYFNNEKGEKKTHIHIYKNDKTKG